MANVNALKTSTGVVSLLIKHFDYFHYHSNHNYHVTTKINDVHNQHIATCSHTKFYQASLNSY